jgi:sortase A
LLRVLIVVTISAGVAVFTYPVAAQWFADLSNTTILAGYVQTAAQTLPEQVQAQLATAQAYNATLSGGPLRDPYTAVGTPSDPGAGKDAYEATLNTDGTGLMAVVRVPTIGVSLPIYHDTGDASLGAGVGHLYGSAVPVGGAGTHSVLVAHSGMIGKKLFTDLDKLHEGDAIYLDVLGQTLEYQVTGKDVVLPNQLDSLAQVPGEDLLTLVTCTPIGVNSHRLLVHARRVDLPAGGAGIQALYADLPGAGVPWWPYPVPATALALALVTRPPRRSRQL